MKIQYAIYWNVHSRPVFYYLDTREKIVNYEQLTKIIKFAMTQSCLSNKVCFDSLPFYFLHHV